MDLRLPHPSSLDSLRSWLLGRDHEHVSHADQLLGARPVDDDAAVGLGGDAESKPAWHVGLDHTGDDVDGRALGGDHQMDPDCTGHLGDPHDRRLHLAAGDHHQVVELVDQDHDEREPIEPVGVEVPGVPLLAVALDVAHLGVGQEVVSPVHLGDRPLQCVIGLLRVRDDPGQQMRDTVVLAQLDTLGVDHDQTHVVGVGPHEQ